MEAQTLTQPELEHQAAELARRAVEQAAPSLLIGLSGPLGAGKSTFARAFLKGLGHRGRVPSPTYTLLEPYETSVARVLHLDLYRIDGDSELAGLGLEDWLADPRVWLLIEWPDRAPGFAQRLDLRLELAISGGKRRLSQASLTDLGRALVGY